MNIILTDIANLSVFIVPVVPVGTSIISKGSNETLEALDHQFQVMNNEAPKEINWSSFFPVNKNYSFVPFGALSNGWLYVAFLELMKKYRLPIRVIFTTQAKIPILNTLATIDEFKYAVDKTGDINYEIKLKEYYEKFYEFLPRDKEVFKYIRRINIKNEATKMMKKFGLIQ